MTSNVDSDAETVLGESPLSPCIWTHTVVAQPTGADGSRQQETLPMEATETTVSAAPHPDTVATALPPRRRELQLSPASQLDVLSQISVLANAQSEQRTATTPAPSSSAGRRHVWAPTMKSTRRWGESVGSYSPSILLGGGKATKRKQKQAPKPKSKQTKGHKKKLSSQADRLAVDMLEWETCSEGDLFVGEVDDERNEWVFDDISDNDFEH